MRRIINQFLGISLMLSVPTKRNPIWHIAMSIIPVALFFIFFLIGGMRMSYHAMLGSLVAFSISAGIVSLPQLVLFLRSFKLQDMFVSSPIHPITYSLGIAFSRLIYVSPIIIIVFIVLLAKGIVNPWSIPITLLILLLAWLTGSIIGFTMSTYMKNIMYIGSIANLGGIMLNMIPPVYYPASLVPESYRWVTILFPSSSAAELLRLVNGQSTPDTVGYTVCWLVLLFYVVIGMLLIIYKSRWREE